MNYLMILQRWFQSSIKLRIIVYIGSVISLLMIVISIGVLLQWRSLIISQQTENTESFARAFSIPVIETLIQTESTLPPTVSMLETHIQNFQENVDGIRYISVQDTDNNILAHSDLSFYGQRIDDPTLLQLAYTREPLTRIFPSNGGWIMETYHPLRIGEKRWGSVILGFDVTPMRDQIENSFFLLLMLTLSAILVTLGLLYYFIHKVMHSLKVLVSEVDRINLDSFEKSRLEPRTDEIGYLMDHFEMLKKRLNESKNQLASAQHQIYQAEKLASIGRLASGVAHEVNNPLNGMRFCVYNIQKDITNTEQTREYLTLINEGLAQIESVVTKLLGYSKQRPKDPEFVDISKQIWVVIDLLEYRIKEKNIAVEVDVAEDLPLIKVDPNLIQEMLMNLVLNSVDAVNHDGFIGISAFASSGILVIKVYDNGSGIAPDDLEHIFDPFFTTKETGKGTGLGLSVTHGIVESHNGSIRVNSEQHRFTEFEIQLPVEMHHESAHS
jgi:two-component system, NtrC family, sensor kinase